MDRISEFAVDLLLILLLALYVWGLLWLGDRVLAWIEPGYLVGQPRLIGLLLFVIASVIFVRIARWREWTRLRHYFLTALSLFLPLVFLSSGVVAMMSTHTPAAEHYIASYCDHADMCGEAFAQMTYAAAVRALPAVLTVPILFWFAIFKLTPLIATQTSTGD